MRWFVLSALALGGCSDIVCGLGTVQDGARCVPAIGGAGGDTAGDTDLGPHPLVPEEFTWIWNTGGCTKGNGKTGNSVYILSQDARVEADGSFTATEQWFWFWKKAGYDDDCVDLIEITGSPMTNATSTMGCQPCDEGFELRRKILENNCGISYERYFVDARRPDEKLTYPAMFMFDTLTPSDTPNVDQAMLVYAIHADDDGDFSANDIKKDYAEGHIYPDDPDNHYGYPADYDWVGNRCY